MKNVDIQNLDKEEKITVQSEYFQSKDMQNELFTSFIDCIREVLARPEYSSKLFNLLNQLDKEVRITLLKSFNKKTNKRISEYLIFKKRKKSIAIAREGAIELCEAIKDNQIVNPFTVKLKFNDKTPNQKRIEKINTTNKVLSRICKELGIPFTQTLQNELQAILQTIESREKANVNSGNASDNMQENDNLKRPI